MTRVVEVDPDRFAGWQERFAATHGPVNATRELLPGGVRLSGMSADGSAFVANPFEHSPLGVLLLRRGAYAVARVDGITMTAQKVGTRHVQGRTAAGGWSQQRFARRRANATDELVGSVTEHAVRLLCTEAPLAPSGLVLGGDRSLVAAVLADRRLAALADLPRRELYDLGEPNKKVLLDAVRRARAYRVQITDAP